MTEYRCGSAAVVVVTMVVVVSAMVVVSGAAVVSAAVSETAISESEPFSGSLSELPSCFMARE